MKRSLVGFYLLFVVAAPAWGAGADMRFDVVTFNATAEGSADHMNQTLFNDLNFASVDGHTITMGGDTHRGDLTGAGNVLGEYYNTWTNVYNGQSNKSGVAAADTINAYSNGFVTTGARPTWVVLNEISGTLWQDTTTKGDTYRQWVVDCVTRLHDVYGYEVIAYAPFANPGAHGDTWQQIAAKAYIGVENYLSGAEVKAQNFSLAWVQGKYASSITSYGNLGVPRDRLILGEEFASTVAGTGYGRDGVSAADWEATIRVRAQAIYNLNFAGFIGYAWGKNGMGLSDADLLAGEDVYRSTMVMPSERPAWVVGGGGSWGVRNNWMAYANVPGVAGDVALFDRSITAAATITLDGNRTVGTLAFNNVNAVTIAAGSGGVLTLDNGGAAPVISVMQGRHKVSAGLAFARPASLTIAAGASLDVTGDALSLAVPVGTLRGYLAAGQLWSSTAAGDAQHRMGLGYLVNGDGSVQVKTTYFGDANLDGRVTADDYALVDRGLAKGGASWAEGDFNYDGVVNGADYLLMDRVVMLAGGMSAGMLAEREARFGEGYVEGLVGSVPEPSVVGVVLVVFSLVRRRRGA